MLGTQLRALKAQILEFDRRITAWHRSNEVSKRLDAIPGIGPALATALVASVADPKVFRSGRDFSAWIGLVPKQNSSGGKDRLGVLANEAIAICAACSRPALGAVNDVMGFVPHIRPPKDLQIEKIGRSDRI